jgi:hypothetical protein
MKTYKNLFYLALTDEIIDNAFKNAIKKKSERPNVKKLIENKEKAKLHLKSFLLQPKYEPYEHRAVIINDKTANKKRIVIQPYFSMRRPEQWVQHIVIQIIKPIIEHGMYEFSCGSIPNRGVHYGKKYLEKYIRNNQDKIRYVLKMDIHHFYESINVELLKEKFKKYISDEKMLNLIYFVLDSNKAKLDNGEFVKTGLPIGFYTSQWFANWFLQPFDHYIKEVLGVKCYVRYMDDIVISGSNKKELHKIYHKIEQYLKTLDLEPKANWQIFKFDYIDKKGNRRGRFIDFMGFKFYRDKTTIRKSIFSNAVKVARRLQKKLNITWYDACQMLSYMGWFYPTATYMAYKKHIETKINIGVCKQAVKTNKKGGNNADKLVKSRK